MHYALFIACLSAAKVIIPIAFALQIGKALWQNYKWICCFLLNHFISEAVTAFLALHKMRNLEAMLFFSLIEGICVLLLYINAIEAPSFKKILNFLLPVYLIGFIGVYFLVDYSLFIPSYTYPFHQFIMLIPLILFFADRMQLMDEIFLTENPMFWISCGFLFYYTVSMFYFGSHDTLFKDYPAVSKN